MQELSSLHWEVMHANSEWEQLMLSITDKLGPRILSIIRGVLYTEALSLVINKCPLFRGYECPLFRDYPYLECPLFRGYPLFGMSFTRGYPYLECPLFRGYPLFGMSFIRRFH